MVVHAWSIRLPDESVADYNLLYESYPGMFSIRLHHSGFFTSLPGRRYVKGKVNYVDCVDIDLFSAIELDDMIESLGLNDGNKMFYHFVEPNSDLDMGLNALGSDQDVHNLSQYIGEHRLIDVYIEHGKSKVDTYFCSPNKHKVAIVDITEDNPQKEKPAKGLFLEWHDEEPVSQVTQVHPKVDKLEIRSLSKGKGVVSDEPVIHMNDVEHVEDPATVGETHHATAEETHPATAEETHPATVGCESDGSDSDDSDFEVDETSEINDIEVDMRDFEKYVDKTIEFMGQSDTTQEGDQNDDEDGVHVVATENFQTDDDSDGETVRKRKKRTESGDGSGCTSVFYLGQTFSNVKEVREMINRHAVDSRRELKMVKNDKVRVRAVCMGGCPQLDDTSGPSGPVMGQCPWTLHISKIKNQETWQVKTYFNEHHCLQSRSIKACTSEFLSHEILEVIQDNPQIPVKALQEQIQRKFEVGISKMKAFRAKAKAAVILKGDHSSQYGILRDYCLEVMKTNPGSTIKIEVEEEPNPDSVTRQFKRIYICLASLKLGFKAGCRELIGLDGCFLKGTYPGQILTAVGIDGNNSIYPVAYAIVEAETLNSWTWFLECLGADLELTTNSNFTFISDRQKGLIPAIAKVFPCAEHRYCLRHIHENMKQLWKGKAYKDLLWKCATSTTVEEFEITMRKMRDLTPGCAEWISKIPPQSWSRSHFSGRACCDLLLNNICEVFNRQLVDGRDKPIIIALEYVREYLMKRIVNVQNVIEKCTGPLTPTATKTLELIKKEAAQYRVIWNGGSKFQVSGPWMDQCVVDTSEKVCTCRKWELTGIPCKHAVAAIWNMSLNSQDVGMIEQWVHKAYWLDTWKQVYSFKVGPISGRKMWPKSDVPTTLIAPKHHKQAGRPKKKRRKGVDESSTSVGKLSRQSKTVTCGKCKKDGHNVRTCPTNAATEVGNMA